MVLAQAYANEREDGHRAILAARGFDAVRHYFEMVRPHIETVRELPVPDGIELRPVTPDQHRAIWEAEHEAFQDHWGARTDMDNDFTSTFGHPALDTSLWVVAWDGDQVAGVAQGWIWLEENEALGVQRGWLERISVRRPWRNRGLGRALTTAGMVRLHMAGMSEAMLGVDSENRTGALGLYEGLGFTIAGRSAAYRRTL